MCWSESGTLQSSRFTFVNVLYSVSKVCRPAEVPTQNLPLLSSSMALTVLLAMEFGFDLSKLKLKNFMPSKRDRPFSVGIHMNPLLS